MTSTVLRSATLRPKPKLWTKEGLATLGRLIREKREAKGLTLSDAAELVRQATQIRLSKKTIGNVENNAGIPSYNTIAAIAAAGFVTDADGRRYTEDDFIDIACEIINPFKLDSQQMSNLNLKNLVSQEVSERGREYILNRTGLTEEQLDSLLVGARPTPTVLVRLSRVLPYSSEEIFEIAEQSYQEESPPKKSSESSEGHLNIDKCWNGNGLSH